ncbi:MAG TPA: prolyl oligopeptidase family serine peptidase [Pseudonocardiaceae bacterium]|nr:prolyl oligopeptidase family serine peptidase [Pseudonocardiaceae bacterium]
MNEESPALRRKSVKTNFLRLQARTQRFTLGTPRDFRVAPDGSRVLFVRSASGTERRHSLWSLDVASGRESEVVNPATLLDTDERLPPEEKARRERSRTQAAGIVGYTTDQRCRLAAFTLSGQLFVVDLASGGVRELATAGSVIDPCLDPTGQRVAYVHGGALRVVEVDGSADRALAEPDNQDVSWGLAEFVAAEEMGRQHGFWWSPTGDRLLAARVDQAAVPHWHIADPANPDRPVTTVAYPAAGSDNATVELALLDLDGSRTDVDWSGHGDAEYLAVARWSRSGPPLLAVQSRDQRRMRVLTVEPATGATTVVQELTDQHWLDIVGGSPAWTQDGRLVTVAPVDGAYRLLLDGRPVTGTDLQVRSVLDVGAKDVLCTGSGADPTQIHVYSVSLAGETRQLSDVDGVHGAARAGDVTVLVSSSLDLDTPKVSVLVDGKPVGEITSLAVAPPLTPNVTLLTAGERELRCALVLPTGHRPGSARLPVLLDPYGGPHAQRVLHARRAYLESQWLADQGFAVLVVDGRGTPGRGPAWERLVHHEFAEVTLADQIDALHAVAARYPDLDTGKVGIRGWSYGGYLAALAVLRRPDAVHAAVAGAPVTDWRLYDTHYTERYLGNPHQHPEVYERNSLLADAPGLRRPLLLIHGMADDNVFAAHTLRLSAALLAHGRPHTVLPMTGVTHMSPSAEAEAENLMLLQLNWLRQALGLPA